MKGAASSLYGSGAAAGSLISAKKLESSCWKCAYGMGYQTTADRVNYRPQDYNQGLSVNGNVDKFNCMLL
jgi:vitamin B12 transporter